MSKIAVVFGFSEQGEYLAKRLVFSFYEHLVKHCQHDISIFPYECNFEILDQNNFGKGMTDQGQKTDAYRFVSSKQKTDWNDLPSSFKVVPMYCSEKEFTRFFLPDVAVYNDFAIKHSNQFDFVLYCHDDLIFTPNLSNLDGLISTLTWDSEYSFIAELRSMTNYNISLRFNMCFVLTSVEKFHESSLSFVNDYVLMDGNEFHIYGNGGSGLMASAYKKHHDIPRWKPYLLHLHDNVSKGTKWFEHVGGIEWNRSLKRESSAMNRTIAEYAQAKEYVKVYKQRYNISS